LRRAGTHSPPAGYRGHMGRAGGGRRRKDPDSVAPDTAQEAEVSRGWKNTPAAKTYVPAKDRNTAPASSRQTQRAQATEVIEVMSEGTERGMPGAFDVDLSNERSTSSYAPTPTLSPLTPRDPQTIVALRDEIAIGHIANNVPMDPEFLPEPPETSNLTRSGAEAHGRPRSQRRVGPSCWASHRG